MMNLRSNFFKNILLFGFLSALFLSSCKRVVKTDADEVSSADDIEEVSKAEYQRMMNLKLPLKTVLIDQRYSLTIPENSDFEVSKVSSKEIILGDIDLTKIDSNFLNVSLNNFFTRSEGLYSEEVYIVPGNDPKQFSIADLKASNERIDAVYYEDENSVIYVQGGTFFTYSIEYDNLKKCFLFYKGEISWTQKYPKKQKLELSLLLVKHAKSLTVTDYPPVKFTSWNDYVKHMPVLEINWINGMFKKIEKELKFFLEPNEQASPRTPGNYAFVKLFRPSPDELLSFYKGIDQLKANKIGETDYYSRPEILRLDSRFSYVLKEEMGCYVVMASSKNDDGSISIKETTVFCSVDYKGKTFILKTDKDLSPSDADFFVKMFSYFSKHYTLNTTTNP